MSNQEQKTLTLEQSVLPEPEKGLLTLNYDKWYFDDHMLTRSPEHTITSTGELEEQKPLTLEEAKAIIAEEDEAVKRRRELLETMMKEPIKDGVIRRGIAYELHPRLWEALCVVEGKDPKKEIEKSRKFMAEVSRPNSLERLSKA